MKSKHGFKACARIALLGISMLVAGITGFSQVRISGKVTDPAGKGLIGISVTVRSTYHGGTTDGDGNYNFTANIKSGNYDLVFSGIGYKSKTAVLKVGTDNSYTVNSQLSEDALGLDEVIVTGTSEGTTKRQLGNYISTLKAEDLNKGATGNVLAALQGKTPGAQIIQNSGDPAGGISVRLRGISSISSSSEPLYIIDGVIVNNSTTRVTNTQSNYDGTGFVGTVGQNRMVDINPADIERVEILNGAAAAAIYGSRANAGVIQIFTKRGKSGAPVVSFTTGLTMSELRKKIDVNQSPVKFGGPTDGPTAQTQDVLPYSPPAPAVLLTNTTPVTRYDYQDYIFRTAIGTDNNLSVSGGSDKTKYFASGSYFFNQGIIKNTDFQRFSFRFNLDQTMNKWLSFNLGMNYVNSQTNEKPDGNSFFSPMNSVTIIGNYHDIWARDASGNLKAVGERGRANPVSVLEDIKQKQITSRTISSFGLKLKPMKNLSVDYTLGIDNYLQTGTSLIPPYAYNVMDGIYGGGITLDAVRNGYASTANNNFFGINHDLNANYSIDISPDLSSTTQLGFSQQYERTRYSLLQGRGLAPYAEVVTAAATILPAVDERSEISITGAYLQQNFKYRNHLFLTGAVRLDGSSVFGKDERNQVYAKVSGSYILSSTDYWEKLGVSSWWDLFKLRAAYGQSGNLTGIGAYDRLNTYLPAAFVGKSALNGSPILRDPNIKPERQQETEFGTDMAFFKNRLSFSANVYFKKVKDLIVTRIVAPTTGYSSYLTNLGSLENKGFELMLGGEPVRTKDFSWNINGIFNRNRNKAINIGQALNRITTNAGAPVAIITGEPIGVFYGTFFARDDQGAQLKNPAGILLTERGKQDGPLKYTTARTPAGLPTGDPLVRILGNPNPDYTATLTNEFRYKRFNARIQLDAVQGVDVWNADWRTRQGVGGGKVAEQEQRGEIPRGYVFGAYNVEEWRIDDGSFVKLREVSLSYSFGKVKSFSDITLSLSGRNLISWDDYKGYDPEVNAGGQSTILRGIDFGAVPIPRTFSFTVQAKL